MEVTAVELDPQIAKIYRDYFPDDKVIVADAHQYLLDHYKEFDFIWASPPCPTHSRVMYWGTGGGNYNSKMKTEYPDMKLYQEILLMNNYFKGKYVIENVIPFYSPLIVPTKELHRHLYWANFKIGNYQINNERRHYGIKNNSTIYGFNISDKIGIDKVKTLRNMVDPELALYILNCARNILTKSNVNQTELF